MQKIVANLVVSRSDATADDALVIVELDAEKNGEETSFSPGDTIWFLVHHAPDVVIQWVKATHGNIADQGAVSRKRTDRLLWTDNEDEHQLSYIPASGFDLEEYGNSVSGLKKNGVQGSVIDRADIPALTDLTYDVNFKLYKLSTPRVILDDDETYPITIVVRT